MLWRVIEGEVVPTCEELGIGQIVWSPIAQGVLTGKYKPGEAPPPDSRAGDDRTNNSIGEFLSDETLAAVQKLRPIAEGAGLTMKDVAQPARVALTGRSASPPLFDVMTVLGKTQTLARLARAVELAQGA